MSIKRRIAHKLAGYGYRFKGMPFRKKILQWDINLQELFTEYLNGEIKESPQLWWHSPVYRVGMWFNEFKRCRRFGEWVVHQIPYNIRFKLA